MSSAAPRSLPRLASLGLALLLVVVPLAARAQAGPPGGPPADTLPSITPEERARMEKALEERRREQLHPVGLLLAHRAQLAIGDSQAALLEGIRARYDARNEPSQRRIDSLRAVLGEAMASARGGALTAEQRDAFRTARLDLNAALAQARLDDAAVREETSRVLTADQLAAARQIADAIQRELSQEASRQTGWNGDDGGAERRRAPGGRGRRAGPGVGSVSGPGGPPSR